MNNAINWSAVMSGGALAKPLRTPSLEEIRACQMVLAEMPQVELEPEHAFAPGMYIRTQDIPAGLAVVGKQHKHEHPVFLMQGECTILTEKGMEKIKAPHQWVSKPGAKRILVTHTDCKFTTVHLNASDTQDLIELEDDIIIPEPMLTHTPKEIGQFHEELQEIYA